MSMMDAYWSSPSLRREAPSMALITIGSVEQHGAHLPVGTDWIVGQALAPAVARQLNAYCLPVMPFGTAREHAGNPGTVFLEPQTLMQVVTDLCLALGEEGFHKICVLQTHGGNWVIKPTARDLNLKHPELTVVWADPFRLAATALREICPTSASEVHAGEMETSLMLHIAHDSVDMSKAVDFVPEASQEYLDYLHATDLCPGGVWGRPTLATKEKGARVFEALVTAAVAYFSSTHERLQEMKR
jgi:creatinine amidohydrolase